MEIQTQTLKIANNNLKREGAEANARRNDFVMLPKRKDNLVG